MRRLTIGSLVDYCIEYNEAHGLNDNKEKKDTRRKATQGDWDAFFG